MKKYCRCAMVLKVFLLSFAVLFAGRTNIVAQIPSGQDAGSVETRIQQERLREEMQKELREGREDPDIEMETQKPALEEDAAEPKGPTVFIKKIRVEGATALSEKSIDEITSQYENRELTFAELREAADRINELYQKKGYPTTTAYFVPQRIEDDTVVIKVAEGSVGNVDIEGNRYFSDRLLLRYIDNRKGELFNYDALRANLRDLNEHPDRNVSAVLVKGDEPGQSDVHLEVQDRLPWHMTLGYNNYNSKNLQRNKYSIQLKNTNFLGMDDVASAEVQLGEGGSYQLYSASYLFPFNADHKLGLSYIRLEQELAGALSALDIKGSGEVISLYYSWRILNTENMSFSLNPGFDYKDINNDILGGAIKTEDNVRIAKLGMDLDISDRFYGRTLITHEFDWGIPDIFGGLSANNDGTRADAGSGGQFFKTVTNAARIQQLPWEMSLMMKGAIQLTGESLVSTEQYTIGGPTTVRGYPVAEYAGDRGYLMSGELYMPPYFIPKDWKVPFTETSFYDALRFVSFFDWGRVENKNAQPGEISQETLYSFGPAVRFDIPEKLSVSFDYGFGLGQRGSDGNKTAGYIEVKLFL